LYAQTQATPYAANLHSGFRASDGSLQLPTTSVTAGATARQASAFTLKGSLVPGLVLVRAKDSSGALGESVTVATGAENEVPFGLLANFVGGDLDEGFSGDSLQNSVGVWRGPDSVFEILSPAFDSDGTGSSGTSVVTTAIGASGGIGATNTIKSLTYPPTFGGTAQTTATTATNAFGAQAISTAISGTVNNTSGIYLYAGVDGRLVSMTTPGVNRMPVARLIDSPATSRIVVDLLV